MSKAIIISYIGDHVCDHVNACTYVYLWWECKFSSGKYHLGFSPSLYNKFYAFNIQNGQYYGYPLQFHELEGDLPLLYLILEPSSAIFWFLCAWIYKPVCTHTRIQCIYLEVYACLNVQTIMYSNKCTIHKFSGYKKV